jgi:hypothetical protein
LEEPVEPVPKEKLLPYANRRNFLWSSPLKNFLAIHYQENLLMNLRTGKLQKAWSPVEQWYQRREIVVLESKFLLVREDGDRLTLHE